jgi:hypothetical protein
MLFHQASIFLSVRAATPNYLNALGLFPLIMVMEDCR